MFFSPIRSKLSCVLFILFLLLILEQVLIGSAWMLLGCTAACNTLQLLAVSSSPNVHQHSGKMPGMPDFQSSPSTDQPILRLIID